MTTATNRTRLATESTAVASEDQLMIVSADATTLVSTPSLAFFISELIATGGDLDPDASEFADLDDKQRRSLVEVRTLLLDSGFLEPVPASARAARACVSSLFVRGGGQVDKEEIARRLDSATVSVVGDHLPPDLDGVLAPYGVSVQRVGREFDAATGDVVIVSAADEFDPVLAEWNTHALNSSDTVAWLCVVPPIGNKFTVGPWFYTGRSACHTCYRLRRASTNHNEELRSLVARGSSLGPSIDRYAADPAFGRMQADLVADAVVRHIALDGAFGQAAPGHLATYEYTLDGLTVDNHRLLRVPRCPECSGARGGGYPQVWFHDEAERG